MSFANKIMDGFNAYLLSLQEKNGNSNSKTYNISDASIFLYSKEFKDYIRDEYNISTADLSKSINEILNMEVVNGKLVDPDEEAKKETEQTKTVNFEGNNSSNTDVNSETGVLPLNANEQGEPIAQVAAEGAEAEAIPENIEDTEVQPTDLQAEVGEFLPEGLNPDQLSLTDLFNLFLQDESFAKAIDNNQDGEYTQEELAEFFNHINSIDGDEENLSLDDLLGAFDDIQAHNAEHEETEEVEVNGPANSVSGPTGAYSNGGGIKTPEKTLKNMTRKELETELSTAEQTLSDNQTSLSDAISGNTPALIQMQETIDSTYDIYLEELEHVDKDMAADLDTIVKDITAKEGEISDKEQEIADQENTVSEAEGSYNNAVSTREALETQLGQLQTALGKETDEGSKAEISSAISSVEDQIRNAERAEKDAKDNWDAQQKTLDGLNKEKVGLDGELEKLKTSKSEIEEQIDAKYPEVAEYKNAYNEAKSAYDTAKDKAISDAEAKVSESQKYVNDVKSALNDRDIKDTAKENLKSISGFSQYNEEKGKALAEMALKLYGNDYYANGNCAGGVADIIQATLGYRTHGNGCDYATELANYPDDWLNVTDEIESLDDLRNLPPGAVVSWSTYEPGHTASNGRYGHVWMSDGNGHEISDFIADVSLNYASWGATFTVYIPV